MRRKKGKGGSLDMALKELLAKIDDRQNRINKMRPLTHETVASLRDYYKIGLTWSSNAMEGNTLTESETKVVIEDGLTIGGKPLKDHLEACGHADAFQEMMERIQKKKPSTKMIFSKCIIYSTEKLTRIMPVCIEKTGFFISGSHYPLPNPERIPDLMKNLIATIEKNRISIHPVLTAARAHLDFVLIHPFVDGNGRVARLMMNLILLQGGFGIALIPPVLRSDYIASLEAARENDDAFLTLICGCVYETQKDYLRMMGF